MQKITTVSVRTEALSKIRPTLFGLISNVRFVVFTKFMRSMGELTSFVVRTEPILHELSA